MMSALTTVGVALVETGEDLLATLVAVGMVEQVVKVETVETDLLEEHTRSAEQVAVAV
jgi:Flp pilus assembly pilin Flp